MSVFSLIGHALGGLVGASTEDVDAKRKALEDAIKSGALASAAQYGQAGQALQNQGDALRNRNAALDYSAPEADDRALAAVRQHYYDQYANGGLVGQAAVAAQQQARGLAAQGGIAGIRADTLRSDESQDKVAQAAQSEITQAGDAANQLDSQKAAVALRKAVLQAQVSHANIVKNLNAQQAQFGLTNSQQQLNNDAQSSLNEIQNQGTSTGIDQQTQEARVGQQILGGLLSAGAGLTSGAQALSVPSAANGGISSLAPVAPAQVGYVASPTGGGYTLPVTAQVGSTPTYASRVYTPPEPIFQTPPTLPTTASFFNRGAR